MPNLKGITIDLGLSDKSVLKLRAIAKHAEALADELDAIDNAEQEECKTNEVERVKCTHLTSKQIERIRSFIGNYDKRKMPICSCDITRVLELVEESPTHEGDG